MVIRPCPAAPHGSTLHARKTVNTPHRESRKRPGAHRRERVAPLRRRSGPDVSGPPEAAAPVHKRRLGRAGKALRLALGMLDPRAWAHAARLVDYYNYSHVIPRRDLRTGPGCAINPNATFANPLNISTGARVSIGARSTIRGRPGRGRGVIEDDVLFGPEVLVTAANYRLNDSHPVTRQAMDEADVVIGRDAWLGAWVMVMPDVSIGAGTMVGAGAVVTRDLPPISIAAGIPARVVGTRRIAGGAKTDGEGAVRAPEAASGAGRPVR